MKPKKLKSTKLNPGQSKTLSPRQLVQLHAKVEALKPAGLSHSAWSDALSEMAYNAANRAVGAGLRRIRKAIK